MKGLSASALVFLGLTTFTTAYAATFSDVVVFGDSLSDNGNVFAISSSLGAPTPPSPPYFDGRFSNGPVAVETIAANYGVPLLDFAYGGATTGLGDEGDGGNVVQRVLLPGLTSQFLAAQSTIAPIASSSLFIVWGGPDDLDAPTPGQTSPVTIANTAATNIINIVKGIQALGGTQILVPGAPALGLAPDYSSNPAIAAAANLFAATFNADLISGLPNGATYVDTFNLLENIAANGSAYGFTNTTDSCLTATTVCSNPNQYLFWDGQHPTEAGQLILAGQLESAAVPEPGTVLLSFGALTILAGVRRYSRRGN
jgi:phospholipase/lecithinase/hemolysin